MAATKQVLERNKPASSWATLGWFVREAVPNARFVRYSCSNCFQWLWSSLENKNSRPVNCSCWLEEMKSVGAPNSEVTGETERPNLLVIGYDGSPDKYARPAEVPHIHLDKMFSPVSLYSLLAAQRLSEESSGASFDYWLIIDPNRRIDNLSETIASLLHPFVQIIDGETSLFTALDQLSREQSLNEDKLQTSLEHLKQLFTRNENRHAVTNIIGPLLLGFQPTDPSAQSVVSYLNHVLHILKLCSPPTTSVLEPTASERQRLSDSAPLNFILVDDQISDGWDQVVATALGFDFKKKQSHKEGNRFVSKEHLELTTYDSAEFILQRLEQTESNTSSKKTKEVFLLDLCLFEGQELSDEARSLTRVLNCAERFCKKSPHALPVDELDRVRAWLERAIDGKGAKRTDETYLDAITLLPRVLSLTDSSLPVMIFSSLGKDAIANRFGDFPNVLTGFEKPALTDSHNEDLATRTRQTFWSAIDRALSLCEAEE